MNELDNPFTSAVTYTGNRLERPDLTVDDKDEEPIPDDVPPPGLQKTGKTAGEPQSPLIGSLDRGLLPEETAGAHIPLGGLSTPPQVTPPGKLKLQRVHQLFEWVSQGCRKYGHERMTAMIDAYWSMGYIADEASDQIREIMRIVPETRGDVQYIGPNEFVSELYVLNRILDPDDATLDREMIEVLMLTRRNPEKQDAGEPPSHERDASDTWIDLLDRI